MFLSENIYLNKYGNIFLIGSYTHLIFTVGSDICVMNSINNDNRNCV